MIPGRMAFFDPVPPGIKDVVTILYRRGEQGVLSPIGTGFLLSYPGRADSGFYTLMITSRHVVTDSDGKFCLGLQVRANRVGGGTTLVPLRDKEPESLVFFHRDPLVDLCVLPGHFHGAEAEVKALHPEFLAQPNELKAPDLQEGLEIVFLGLFTGHPGQTKNLPIVRFGRISAVPTEPVRWGQAYLELVLIEAQCFPGNSGAPVLVFLPDKGPRLLGVLKGSFTQPAVRVSDDLLLESFNGISAVVPAYLLEDMLREDVIPALERRGI